MYIVVIAWFYVVVLMAIAEATSSNGTVLGALITFVLYGVLPLSIVVYILGTPGRRRKVHARQMQERAEWEAKQAHPPAVTDATPEAPSTPSSTEPDAGSHATGSTDLDVSANRGAALLPGDIADAAGAIAPVRKEP